MVTNSAKKDILIPDIGATGAGKSSLINSLLGQVKMAVGGDLERCTTEIDAGNIEQIEGHPLLQEYRIVLIDTPGFDDTRETNDEILKKIDTWLKDLYENGAKLGGVIYLHDISTPGFTGTATRNLEMFRSLCGEDNIVLGTTKWDMDMTDSALHYHQLVADHWKSLLDKGAKDICIRNYPPAEEVIKEIIDLIKHSAKAIAQSEKEDILILVMGASGVGKSTFINTLIGQRKMLVGGGLKSCTIEPDIATIDQHSPANNQLNIIDTPGFDDTIETTFTILKKIATCLEKSYTTRSKLGIIYLHDITTPRFEGSPNQHLNIFRKLCGKGGLDHIVLATTKWDLNIPYSEENQNQLETKYWKPLTDKGANVRRFHGSRESAQSILDAIIPSPFVRPQPQTLLHIGVGHETTSFKKFMKKTLRPFVGLFRRRRVSA